MGAKWKKGVNNIVAVDLGKDDIYGLDKNTFQCFYIGPDGVAVDVGPFDEFIKSIDEPATTNLVSDVGDLSIGTKEIPVEDASGFKKGMVVTIANSNVYFYVEEVDTSNNILIARRGISKNVVNSGQEVYQVGNTGVYGCNVTLDNTGVYFFIIKNPSIGLMNKTAKVEVVEYDESDLYKKANELSSKLDGISDTIGSLDGTGSITSVDGEIIV
jgi:hypothetical protein